MNDKIINGTDSSFEQDVLKSAKPVLVDFWAEWCGPCKRLAPLLNEAADTYDGKLQVVKMDVDKNSAIPAQFGVRGIPTLIVFKDGKPVAQKVGALGKAQLTDLIDRHV